MENKRKHYAFNRTYQPIQLKALLFILKETIRNCQGQDIMKMIEIIEEIELRID
jgi:hypothetical protein